MDSLSYVVTVIPSVLFNFREVRTRKQRGAKNGRDGLRG